MLFLRFYFSFGSKSNRLILMHTQTTRLPTIQLKDSHPGVICVSECVVRERGRERERGGILSLNSINIIAVKLLLLPTDIYVCVCVCVCFVDFFWLLGLSSAKMSGG